MPTVEAVPASPARPSGSSRSASLAPPHEFLTQTFEPTAHARIHAHRAGLQDETADQVRVDFPRRLDLAPRRLLDLLQQVARLGVRELTCSRQLDVQSPFLDREQAVELAGDLLDLPDATLLRDEAEEVAHELVGVTEQLVEHRRLRARLELRVTQHGAQLGNVVDGGGEVGELLADLLQAAVLLRGIEQCPRIRAVDDGYLGASSSAEKSRSPIASSIRRRWSASSSTLPVTFAVATSVSSATSARICSSARCVSASIWRFVSSCRRWRSASVSSFTRWRCESATRRASARISSAWPRACPISARCSWSSLRASSRAWSASSSERLMRSRRSSMSFWIGPNA